MNLKYAQNNVDHVTLTIPEAEEIIEDAFSEIAESSAAGLQRALQFLAPEGYTAIVELCDENGRSKRRNAPSTTWSPEEDEIRIYFERDDADEDGDSPRPRLSARPVRNFNTVEHDYDEDIDDSQLAVIPADMDVRVKELCAALAEAERGGHAFIALKWFRDSFLPRKAFRWNQNPDARQAVLAECIQRGVVLTSKIPNPKTPAYPTTTIRLNRAEAGLPEEAQRFRPVSITGDSISAELELERGGL